MPFRMRAAALFVFIVGFSLPAAAQTLRVSASTTNLRAKPAADAPIVATLAQGAELDAIGQDGQWHLVRVRASGVEGYVHNLVVESVAGGQRPANVAAPAAAQAAPPAPPRPTPVAAPEQAPPVQSVSRDPGFTKREPVVALILSLLYPGIGQFYNGPTETKKGLIMAGAAAGSFVLMVAGASSTDSDGSSVAALGALGYTGVAVYSMYDAATRAGQLNREHGLAFNIRPEFFGGRTGVRSSISYTHTF